jgi:hypothetical protein
MDYGIKMSKPGVDVNFASDRDLIFSSKFQALNIIQSGTFNVNITDYNQVPTVTIYHNLGYAPCCMLFGEVNATGQPSEAQIMTTEAVNDSWTARVYTDRIEVSYSLTQGSIIDGTGHYGLHYGSYLIFPREII